METSSEMLGGGRVRDLERFTATDHVTVPCNECCDVLDIGRSTLATPPGHEATSGPQDSGAHILTGGERERWEQSWGWGIGCWYPQDARHELLLLPDID